MSLVRTLDEWIRSLENQRKYEGGDTLFVGNLYSAGDIRENSGLDDDEGDAEEKAAKERLDEIDDKSLLELFEGNYGRDEEEVYYSAVSSVRDWLYAEHNEGESEEDAK
jgi:hypothetical protein